MTTDFDVAIIGAGPAGMAAAIETTRAGRSTVLLDEQHAPGGQIYRGVEQADPGRLKLLGHDYAEGRDLTASFRSSGATYLPGATVWNVTRDLKINYSTSGVSSALSTGALVIASGAIERPTPIQGWTLPGVMTAGACQILLKAHGLVESGVVFVGSGPLLWLIAAQMVATGVMPKAIVETVPWSRYFAALRRLPVQPVAAKYLWKGATMMRDVRRAGVPIYSAATEILLTGTEKIEAVSFRSGGRSHTVEASFVGLHQGVVPNQQITRLLRCNHSWNHRQRCFVPTLDGFGETSLANVFVAGDGGGIGGARVSALQGELVGLRIGQKAGQIRDRRTETLQRRIARELAIRPFLETLYAPSLEIREPADETIICRCEEIKAGEIRAAVDLGMEGPNQVKSFLRNGMGPCQGRMCGLAVTEIIAKRLGQLPDVIDYYRIRPPLKPLAIAELASLVGDPTSAKKVE